MISDIRKNCVHNGVLFVISMERTRNFSLNYFASIFIIYFSFIFLFCVCVRKQGNAENSIRPFLKYNNGVERAPLLFVVVYKQTHVKMRRNSPFLKGGESIDGTKWRILIRTLKLFHERSGSLNKTVCEAFIFNVTYIAHSTLKSLKFLWYFRLSDL